MKTNQKKFILKVFTLFCITGFVVMNMYAQMATEHDSLNVNNISARINLLGDHFNDFNSNSKFEAPANSNKHTIYASSLWVGGYVKNNLKIAAMTYRQSGADFFPGPLDTSTGTTSTANMKAWQKIWKVRRQEIDDFRQNHAHFYATIKDWPGDGLGITGESRSQAPYVDVNHNGIYDPADGDYPDIKGDEMLYWTFNDKGGLHTETSGDALGLEIHAQAFEYASINDALNNTIFFDYKITNRSKNTIDNTYIGLWTDFDLGYAFDDYIGCAPAQSAYFAYNGKSTDAIYGSNTPLQSVVFLKDSMSRFITYSNDANNINGNPGFPNPSPADYYQYLMGKWKNGGCIKFGHNGINGSLCTNYLYDGDPGDTVTGWTEHNNGNMPGDRRAIGAIGPFTLKPGQTFDFPFAYVFSQQKNGNTAKNFQALKGYWTEVKNFYKSGYKSGISSHDAPLETFNLFPNPANTNISITFGNASVKKIVIVDNLGRQVLVAAPGVAESQALMDITGLANGMYAVSAETVTGIWTRKLVIAR